MEKELNKIGHFTEDEFKQQMRVNNANEALANPGFEQTITTTTQIISRVNRATYYELDGQKLSDFVPMEVGFGAFSTEIMQMATKATGADFKAGIISPSAGALKQDTYTDIEVGAEKYHNNFWRDTYSISREGIEMARRNAIPFNVIEEKERARRKKFDLGLQDAWFNGLGDGKSYGLLNQPSAVINTSFMQKELSAMTDNEFSAWVSQIRGLYNSATNATANFDRLLIPQSEYFALDRVFGQFGMTRRQILEEVVKANRGKIVYTTYNETAGTNGNQRYALYKYDADYIQAFMPLEYTPFPLYAVNALDMISNCMAQFVTPVIKRSNTLLYIDVIPQT